MKHAVAVLVTGLALLAPPAHAAVTFDFIFDNGYPLSVSSNGTVVAGNSAGGGYIPFRWTQATGLVSLGRPQIVGGAGVPGISADGSVVASSIGSLDSSYSTQGRWTQVGGWHELMPPPPADGGTQDGSYGSVWALSGDGTTPVGLYNRPGHRGHASKWTQATGVVDLGGCATNQASRANCVNYDASVIAGWVETPTGPWRPAAWVNGSLVLLTDYDDVTGSGMGEARAASSNGNIVVGFARDQMNDPRGLAMWKRTGGIFGATEFLGWVDGTQPNGLNIPYGVSADGRIVIGYCTFDGSPFGTTGFVWTAASGTVVDVNQWLADYGVLVDPNFTIQSLSAMTPDGFWIFGYGQMLTPPYTRRAFRIHAQDVAGVPPVVAAARVALSTPWPNPSSSATHLDFSLPSPASVDLSVFDASGRRVATVLHGELQAGSHAATWDGRDTNGRTVAAGLYFARLTTPQGPAERRIARVD